MTPGQLVNGVASGLVMVASLGFIVTYALTAKWYNSSTGRFLMVKAVGICLTGLITVALTAQQFRNDSDWLRFLQGSLWTIVAAAYLHHTWLVWTVQRRRGDPSDQGN